MSTHAAREAYRLFRLGADTFEIAQRMSLPESHICEFIHEERMRLKNQQEAKRCATTEFRHSTSSADD